MTDPNYKDLSSSRPLFSDEAAFEKAFKEFYTPIYRVVYPIVKNKDTAEDIVQGMFVKMWERRDSLFVTGSLKAYLYRAAINASFDYLDKHKRETSYENKETYESFASENPTYKKLSETEVQQQIALALDKLPPACRTIYILSRDEEMSYKEIAESLQISIKTVENQMGKALKILRKELSPYLKDLIKIFLIWFLPF